ncbi:MAG: ferritin-like domain-containing protein [Planctomycetales bacterium]
MTSDSLDVLNELLHLQYCSLPRYLTYGSPWEHRGNDDASVTVRRMAEDHERMSRRVAGFIYEQGGIPDSGEFPIDFAELHFLSLDYLLNEIVYYQRRELAEIKRLAEQAASDPQTLALVEETLGAEKAHLEDLEKFLQQPA